VAFEDVSFGYGAGETAEDETILDDVSFTVDGGNTLALVGPTGAGKSTVMKLLMRMYDVDEGAVRVDGQDLRDVTLPSLRQAIGYVSQETFLFYGTVKENITYGTFGATDEEIVEAAKAAEAHAFIQNLPEGYDTKVGERGVKLSGGQRQRIAIARAVLKDPDILVLDGATSDVDTETEMLIQRSLDTLTADRTTFAIAHRLSTIKDADQIVVLEDGQVVESRSHAELLEENGLYANLWAVQAGGSTNSRGVRPAGHGAAGPDRRRRRRRLISRHSRPGRGVSTPRPRIAPRRPRSPSPRSPSRGRRRSRRRWPGRTRSRPRRSCSRTRRSPRGPRRDPVPSSATKKPGPSSSRPTRTVSFVAVFQRVAKEVLERSSLEAVRVGEEVGVALDDEVCALRLNHSPGLGGDRFERDRRGSSTGSPCLASESRSSINVSMRASASSTTARWSSSRSSRRIWTRPLATVSGFRRSWETTLANRSRRSFWRSSSRR